MYPGNKFDYHLIPFKAAIEAGAAQVMPYMSIGVEQTREPVGFGYRHQGSLAFDPAALRNIGMTLAAKPTVVCLYLERGAVIPEIAAEAGALLAMFGCSDDAILDVVFGESKPTRKLPIELPRSMKAVKAQKEDVPCDSENPLYEFGFGLTY